MFVRICVYINSVAAGQGVICLARSVVRFTHRTASYSTRDRSTYSYQWQLAAEIWRSLHFLPEKVVSTLADLERLVREQTIIL